MEKSRGKSRRRTSDLRALKFKRWQNPLKRPEKAMLLMKIAVCPASKNLHRYTPLSSAAESVARQQGEVMPSL
jgi:hypothetical protein